MSKRTERALAELFSALGDPTRLELVKTLSHGDRASATSLSEGAAITRQAMVKHLRVLEGAGLVRAERRGREVLYALTPQRLGSAQDFLAAVSAGWDRALLRLKARVEKDAR